MKTSETLRKAADEIRRRGWFQGDYGDNLRLGEEATCRVCSLGAINAARTGNPWRIWEVENAKHDPAAKMLNETIAPEGYATAVVDWNDDPDRTVEEVLEVFEKAAQKAEEVGD